MSNKRWTFDPGSGVLPKDAAADEAGVEPDPTMVICPDCNHQFRAVPEQEQAMVREWAAMHEAGPDDQPVGEPKPEAMITPDPVMLQQAYDREAALPLVQMPLGERWQWVATVLKQLQQQQRRDSAAITALQERVAKLEQGFQAHDNALKQHGNTIVNLINGHNKTVAHLQAAAERRIVVPS